MTIIREKSYGCQDQEPRDDLLSRGSSPWTGIWSFAVDEDCTRRIEKCYLYNVQHLMLYTLPFYPSSSGASCKSANSFDTPPDLVALKQHVAVISPTLYIYSIRTTGCRLINVWPDTVRGKAPVNKQIMF